MYQATSQPTSNEVVGNQMKPVTGYKREHLLKNKICHNLLSETDLNQIHILLRPKLLLVLLQLELPCFLVTVLFDCSFLFIFFLFCFVFFLFLWLCGRSKLLGYLLCNQLGNWTRFPEKNKTKKKPVG